MKMYRVAAMTGGAFFLGVMACNGSWLHRAFSGEFCAHDHKYVVTNDGKIAIQTLEDGPIYTYTGPVTSGGCVGNPCGESPLHKEWTTDITFDNVDQLHDVIGDLQRVEADIKSMDDEK